MENNTISLTKAGQEIRFQLEKGHNGNNKVNNDGCSRSRSALPLQRVHLSCLHIEHAIWLNERRNKETLFVSVH